MGSRYGVRTRKQEAAILLSTRAKHECPKCGKKMVKRVSSSLWECRGCGARFAGGAYTPSTEVGQTARKIIDTAKT